MEEPENPPESEVDPSAESEVDPSAESEVVPSAESEVVPSAESEVVPSAESASAGDEGQSESQEPRADSGPDATPASDEIPAPEASGAAAETAEVSDEPPRAPSAGPVEVAESAPGGSAESAADSAEAQADGAAEEEEYEPTPRQKPEIPGADLEPVFIPREEQYLDAEAQAAAEAEAEAAAERARAEAEDEQAKPIADAAIDLAAGARYTSTGKRKTAVARVIIKPGDGQYLINGKTLDEFFPRETLRRMIRQPLETVGYEARMDVVARMHGGGVSAQAGALRHGIARALIDADPNLRGELKRRGYLTRDPRVKERKKAGLKKARKRPQFSKR
jgi:small subunit ribosomal protein S9